MPTETRIRRPEPHARGSLSDTKGLEKAFRAAVRDALREHKKLGNPIAVWEDGKVVILQPKDIPVDD